MNPFREIFILFRDVINNRKLIIELTRRDFRIRYSKNYLGLAWSVLEPLALLLIMLLVFTYLRARMHSEYPFVAYLMTGLIAYDFFNKSLGQATNSIRSLSFLISQTHIRMAMIPLVGIATTFRTHLIVVGIAMGILLFSGIGFSFYWLQLVYFMLASLLLLTGVTWITSSLIVFFNDIQYVIHIVMRAAFFLTPIFWELEMFPEKFHILLKLNPLYYLVEGYRMCLLYHQPFWSDPFAMVWFWVFSLGSLLLGSMIFKRLTPYFSDVLL